MTFLICRRCDVSYEIYSKGEPLEIGTCTCGNTFEHVEYLDEKALSKTWGISKIMF